MANYHFRVRIIGRSWGHSAVKAAVYRAEEDLFDERLGEVRKFKHKSEVVHSDVFLPTGAPDRLRDRGTLWNEVEAIEDNPKNARWFKTARLARDIDFSLPRELSKPDAIKLARDYTQQQFVNRGMVADLAVHWKKASDQGEQPHVHVMLAMRSVGPDGFGNKVREWNHRGLLLEWRKRLAEMSNERLASGGFSARIDHRTLAEQGKERLRLRDKLQSVVDRAKEFWSTIKAKLSKGVTAVAEPTRPLSADERERLADDLGKIHAHSTTEFWASYIYKGQLTQDIDKLEAQVRATIDKPHQAKA